MAGKTVVAKRHHVSHFWCCFFWHILTCHQKRLAIRSTKDKINKKEREKERKRREVGERRTYNLSRIDLFSPSPTTSASSSLLAAYKQNINQKRKQKRKWIYEYLELEEKGRAAWEEGREGETKNPSLSSSLYYFVYDEFHLVLVVAENT